MPYAKSHNYIAIHLYILCSMCIVVLLVRDCRLRGKEIANHLYAQMMILYALYSAVYEALVFDKLIY